MRRLAWFSGGFAVACLLSCYGCGGIPVLLSGTVLLLLFSAVWKASRPRPHESPAWLRSPARWSKRLLPPRQIVYQLSRRGVALCLGVVLALLWFAAYSALFYSPAERWVGSQTALSGTVCSYPMETSVGGWSVTVRLGEGLTAPDALVYGGSDWASLKPGDRISCTARVTLATRMRGDETTYYTARGVYLLAYCKHAPDVAPAPSVPLRYWPALCGKALRQGISTVFDPIAAPMAVAVTLGDKSSLPDPLYSALSRSGLMHAAAVSGLHISFLVASLLRLSGGRRRAALLLVPLLLFYALMAGGTPSALRAVIMQTAMLAAPLARREGDSLSALGFALLILLVLNPFAAASVSLQLSFSSVAGILLVTPALSNAFMGRADRLYDLRCNPFGRALHRIYVLGAVSLSTSLGVMVFSAPLLALYFGQISLISPLANFLTLWALSALMVSALLVGALAVLFPGPMAILGGLCGVSAHYARWIALGLGRFPFASLSTDNPYCLIWLGALYLVLLLWRLHRASPPRPLIPSLSLAILLAAAIGLGRLSVTFSTLTVAALDVGQGSSTALLSGDRAVLVDCGGNSSNSAGDIAADYFASLGWVRLDLLVLTHLDDDHCNGVEQLFYRMDISEVVLPASEASSHQLPRLLELAEAEGAQVRLIQNTVHHPMGKADITLFPPLGSGTSNEEGLFVLCSAEQFDVLITGDADAFVEQMLVKYQPIPDIELLMVGHHGSNSSTCDEFLNAVRPELAVISSGYNTYGHPSQEVLDRLTALGTQIHRTDLEGTVTITLQGDAVNLY